MCRRRQSRPPRASVLVRFAPLAAAALVAAGAAGAACVARADAIESSRGGRDARASAGLRVSIVKLAAPRPPLPDLPTGPPVVPVGRSGSLVRLDLDAVAAGAPAAFGLEVDGAAVRAELVHVRGRRVPSLLRLERVPGAAPGEAGTTVRVLVAFE